MPYWFNKSPAADESVSGKGLWRLMVSWQQYLIRYSASPVSFLVYKILLSFFHSFQNSFAQCPNVTTKIKHLKELVQPYFMTLCCFVFPNLQQTLENIVAKEKLLIMSNVLFAIMISSHLKNIYIFINIWITPRSMCRLIVLGNRYIN